MGILDTPGYTRGETDAKFTTHSHYSKLRGRDIPGPTDLRIADTPPTFTAGAANAASVITSGILYRGMNYGAHCYMGTEPYLDASNNLRASNTLLGTVPPWADEFYLDDDRFEVVFVGNGGTGAGGAYRVLVDGRLATANPSAGKTDTNTYRDLYVFPSRARRLIRLEFEQSFRFTGVTISATGSIIAATPEPATLVLGDSFTEPTIRDNTATPFGHDGWVNVFGRALGLRNCFPRGSGGTGYLNPGTSPRVKFRDRFAQDVASYNPERIFFAGGINDASREPAITPQMIYDEAMSLFALANTLLPNAEKAVFSPWVGRNLSGSLFGASAAIEKAAVDSGLPFIDLLGLTPYERRVTSTTTTTVSSGTTLITTSSFPPGAVIRIGTPSMSDTPASIAIRTVTSVTGSGPYTLTLDSTLSGGTYPTGSQVVSAGQLWSWGSGSQAALAGTGPNDVNISDDNVHPTVLGHKNAGRAAFHAYSAKINY